MNSYFKSVEADLRSQFEVLKLKEGDFPDFHLKLLKLNALNSLLNRQYQLEIEELKLHFFQVINNQVSQKYFTEAGNYFPVGLNRAESTPILFVVLEEVLGILESNSDQLYVELLLKQGLTAEDSKSSDLQAHLAIVKANYQENYLEKTGD